MKNATHIEVEAEVRYWEDAKVNDVEDSDGCLIFGRQGNVWKVSIDLAAGRIEGWPTGDVARIHYKVCDQGLYWLTDNTGVRLAKYRSDYVPDSFLCHGSDGYGDYIILNVDGDGMISDYQRPEIDEREWSPLPKDAA